MHRTANGLRTPRRSAAVEVGDDECQRSVVEDVPADRASTLLVIKDQPRTSVGILLAASLAPGRGLTLPHWRQRKQWLP